MPAINQYPQLKADDGASNVNFTQAGSNAATRSVQDKLRDMVSVKDFGAVGNGIADDTIAIQAALDSGAATITAKGTFKVSSRLFVRTGVKFLFDELIPSAANVSVMRCYGGTHIEGTINTAAFPTYSGIALEFDGNGENVGSPFRLHIKTYANVIINGGGSTGTAIYFKATDTIARIMGVRLYARINKFQYGVHMEQTSTDLSKFITSNYINIDASDTLLALGMYSSQANEYGLDGNHFVVKAQPSLSATSVVMRLCGQDNTFDLLPWDWDQIAGSAPFAAQLAAFSRRNVIYWHTGWAYLQNLSSDFSNTIIAPHDSGIRTPTIAGTRSDNILPIVGYDPEIENGRYYRAKTSTGTSRAILGISGNDTQVLSPNIAGSNIVYDTLNGTGVHAFRRNGTNVMYLDSVGTTPGSDNTRALGSGALRWSVVYAASGSINTSDEREKSDIRMLYDREKAVAVRLKGAIRAFRYKDAIRTKGNLARIHFGVIAQEVVEAFKAEGLDAERYGVVCLDTWEAQEVVYDADGQVVTPAREAGSRYGVRYEELFAFMLAAQVN